MKNSNTYFNTTNQDVDYVNKRKAKNKTQEVLVYDLFKSHSTLTASEVFYKFPKQVLEEQLATYSKKKS